MATIVGVLVGPPLAWCRRRLGKRTGLVLLRHSAVKTELYVALCSTALVALALSEMVGWWWFDPVGALVIAAVAAAAGVVGWRDASAV